MKNQVNTNRSIENVNSIEEKLNKCLLPELKAKAKSYGISGGYKMRKKDLIAELIEAIICEAISLKDAEKSIEESAEYSAVVSNDAAKLDARPTSDYVEKIELGTIVAFEFYGACTGNKICISGKIVSRNKNGLLIQTKDGREYFVFGNSILWVKTGANWPKWIFERFAQNKIIIIPCEV